MSDSQEQLPRTTVGDPVIVEQQALATLDVPATSLERYGDGPINFVTVVGRKYVIKMPKQPQAPNEQMVRVERMLRERAALTLLGRTSMAPIAVPRLLGASNSPAYNIVSYIPGFVPQEADILTLPVSDREMLGVGLGQFLLRLSDIDTADFPEEFATLGSFSWAQQFADAAPHFDQPDYPTFTGVAHELYDAWLAAEAQNESEPVQLVHGDLRPENMVIQNNRLYGVFDFGNAHLSTLSVECNLLAYDDAVLESCAQELANAGLDVDVRTARTIYAMRHVQAVAQELEGGRHSPLLLRCLNYLQRLYPERDWSEAGSF